MNFDKVTEIRDYKYSKVKEPNLFMEAVKFAFCLMGIMIVVFVLCFSKEIVQFFVN